MATKISAQSLAAAQSKLKDIDRRHGEYMDELLAQFEERLDRIIETATAQVLDNVIPRLKLNADGDVPATIGNLRVLQNLDTQFQAAMKSAGYDSLTLAWVKQFPEQLPLLTDTLRTISKTLKVPLNVSALTKPAEQNVLLHQQSATLEGLRDIVVKVAINGKRKALAKVNGLEPRKLSDLIAKSFQVTDGQARTLAATGMATFYRVATARALDQVEKETPLRYVYDGPDDRLTREFCHRLKSDMQSGRSWTKAEIEAMDNGQLPNPFLSCGGYNCRHQWRIALNQSFGPLKSSVPGNANVSGDERKKEAALENQARSKAKREAAAIARQYPANAPIDLQRDNLLDQAKVFEEAGLRVPGRITNALSALVGQASPAERVDLISGQLLAAKRAASALDKAGARAAWRQQMDLVAQLRQQLAKAKAAVLKRG